MDRHEAMLRELNLYPLWVRREQPAPDGVQIPANEAVADVAPGSLLTECIPAQTAAEVQQSGEDSLREFQSRIAAGPLAGLDWTELKQKVHDCQLCKLRAGCTQTVFGVGDEQADWLFVGEGPGADEDVQGEPFVGQAGRLLDNMLMAIKLKRGSNVYIANVVKCRPPGNRNPHDDESAACFPYLKRQIELIQPKVIVALGKVAASTLLGTDATIGSLRGKLHEYKGIPLIVTYHPAYLLRSPMEKARAWQDLRLAVATMEGRLK